MGTAQAQPSQPFRQAPPSTPWNPQLDLFLGVLPRPLAPQEATGAATQNTPRRPPPGPQAVAEWQRQEGRLARAAKTGRWRRQAPVADQVAYALSRPCPVYETRDLVRVEFLGCMAFVASRVPAGHRAADPPLPAQRAHAGPRAPLRRPLPPGRAEREPGLQRAVVPRPAMGRAGAEVAGAGAVLLPGRAPAADPGRRPPRQPARLLPPLRPEPGRLALPVPLRRMGLRGPAAARPRVPSPFQEVVAYIEWQAAAGIKQPLPSAYAESLEIADALRWPEYNRAAIAVGPRLARVADYEMRV